jgi:hypothetical protein
MCRNATIFNFSQSFVGCLILTMRELCSFETSVSIHLPTWRKIPEDVKTSNPGTVSATRKWCLLCQY